MFDKSGYRPTGRSSDMLEPPSRREARRMLSNELEPPLGGGSGSGAISHAGQRPASACRQCLHSVRTLAQSVTRLWSAVGRTLTFAPWHPISHFRSSTR
jgi:hypothetical protein